MGFGADQVDQWEPYQLSAVWRGWQRAHATKTAQAPSDEEFRAAVARTMH